MWRAPFGPASLRNRHRAGRGTEARAAAPGRVTGPAGRHGAEARARVPSKTRVPSAQPQIPSKAPVPSAPRAERAVWRARLRLSPSSRRWSRSYGAARWGMGGGFRQVEAGGGGGDEEVKGRMASAAARARGWRAAGRRGRGRPGWRGGGVGNYTGGRNQEPPHRLPQSPPRTCSLLALPFRPLGTQLAPPHYTHTQQHKQQTAQSATCGARTDIRLTAGTSARRKKKTPEHPLAQQGQTKSPPGGTETDCFPPPPPVLQAPPELEHIGLGGATPR